MPICGSQNAWVNLSHGNGNRRLYRHVENGFLDFAQPTAAGYFDAVGALEHEISAVMGRVDAVGSAYGAGLYTPLDLFRYSAPGVHATSATRPLALFFDQWRCD